MGSRVLEEKEAKKLLEAVCVATGRKERMLAWMLVGEGMYFAQFPNLCSFLFIGKPYHEPRREELCKWELHITDVSGFREPFVMLSEAYSRDLYMYFASLATLISQQIDYFASSPYVFTTAGEQEFLQFLIKRLSGF